MTSQERIDVDNREIFEDGSGNLSCPGAPFTGEVAKYFNGFLISLQEYVDGMGTAVVESDTKAASVARKAGQNAGSRSESEEWHAVRRKNLLSERPEFVVRQSVG
ncbi:hypothetical protein [Streptomyces sp. NPDC049916]|uniref:hypothetical protein n=1 Tax=Streptomyces sp. NPDC049916 TaxID=3155156 RepID=UPI003433A7C4